MTNLIDHYLLKSGMPASELCVIDRAKRAFYYYSMMSLAAIGLTLLVLGLTSIIN